MATPKRIAIVTGAAVGIGKATAIRLAQDGWNIALNDLPSSIDKLVQVAEQVSLAGGEAILVPGDVSEEEAVKKMIDDTVEKLGGVDAMIANAGISSVAPLTHMTAETWDKTFAVNARGTFLCYKYAILQMIKQGRGGRVVGASSVYGKKGGPNCAHYSATKFAIRGLTQAAAQEVGKHGITVNAYAPGFINTPMLDNLPDEVKVAVKEIWNAQGYEGQPEDVANVVSFLVSEKSGLINGQTLAINGGWHVMD